MNIGYALKFAKNQTDELCKRAVMNNGRDLKLVKNERDELCKLAVMNDFML